MLKSSSSEIDTEAPVHGIRLTGGPAGGARGEERHHGGDVARLAEAPDDVALQYLLRDFLVRDEAADRRRARRGDRDAVHRDVVATEAPSERAHQARGAGLRGGVR